VKDRVVLLVSNGAQGGDLSTRSVSQQGQCFVRVACQDDVVEGVNFTGRIPNDYLSLFALY
jgi:hypothetical protein